MKSKTNKILNNDPIVTQSILKKELDKIDRRFDKIDQRFNRVEQRFEKVDQRFENVDQRFTKIEVQLDGVTKAIQIIIKELGNMRKENREFYQMREQLYANDLIQERKLDDHESRLHKLEIA